MFKILYIETMSHNNYNIFSSIFQLLFVKFFDRALLWKSPETADTGNTKYIVYSCRAPKTKTDVFM